MHKTRIKADNVLPSTESLPPSAQDEDDFLPRQQSSDDQRLYESLGKQRGFRLQNDLQEALNVASPYVDDSLEVKKWIEFITATSASGRTLGERHWLICNSLVDGLLDIAAAASADQAKLSIEKTHKWFCDVQSEERRSPQSQKPNDFTETLVALVSPLEAWGLVTACDLVKPWEAADTYSAIPSLWQRKMVADLQCELEFSPRKSLTDIIPPHFSEVYRLRNLAEERLCGFCLGVVLHQNHSVMGPRIQCFGVLSGLITFERSPSPGATSRISTLAACHTSAIDFFLETLQICLPQREPISAEMQTTILSGALVIKRLVQRIFGPILRTSQTVKEFALEWIMRTIVGLGQRPAQASQVGRYGQKRDPNSAVRRELSDALNTCRIPVDVFMQRAMFAWYRLRLGSLWDENVAGLWSCQEGRRRVSPRSRVQLSSIDNAKGLARLSSKSETDLTQEPFASAAPQVLDVSTDPIAENVVVESGSNNHLVSAVSLPSLDNRSRPHSASNLQREVGLVDAPSSAMLLANSVSTVGAVPSYEVWGFDERLLSMKGQEEMSFEEARAALRTLRTQRIFTVMCRTSFGKVVTLRLAPGNTIRYVKSLLRSLPDSGHFEILFEGVLLKDHQTLEYCGITSNSTLRIIDGSEIRDCNSFTELTNESRRVTTIALLGWDRVPAKPKVRQKTYREYKYFGLE